MRIQDNIFTTVIQSCMLTQLPLNTQIYNVADFSDVVCVKLPPQMPRDLDLSELYCLDTFKDIEFSDYVTRDEHRPWVDIPKTILDTSIGQHVYRMTFQKPECKLKATCWFSYIIQDNNPEKPYIYMNREENSEVGSQ